MELVGTESPLELVGTESPLELAGIESPLELAMIESSFELVGTESPLELAGTESPQELVGTENPLELARIESLLELIGTKSLLELVRTKNPLELARTESQLELVGTESTLVLAKRWIGGEFFAINTPPGPAYTLASKSFLCLSSSTPVLGHCLQPICSFPRSFLEQVGMTSQSPSASDSNLSIQSVEGPSGATDAASPRPQVVGHTLGSPGVEASGRSEDDAVGNSPGMRRELIRVSGVCQDDAREFIERRPRLTERLSRV
ncbi:hypothetical protein BHM03_00047586, partial [Ensete ventricosum]